MTESKHYPHILRKTEIEARQSTFSHPWNPKSEISGTWMGHLAGLTRTGVSIGRLASGKEAFAYHLHHTEEEWLYILSGRAVAHIDGQDYALEPGDFVAFPTPSAAHNMANPYDEELVYLMGGENKPDEVADFPTLDRRMVKIGGKLSIYKLSDGKPFLEDGA
ncbi:MAG: cupin domain-containing protein [Rhodocyclaceae bacterium]|nr:MAG: cupin domain-containing protein [Rhodocyclaceae bacterium]